MRQDKTIYIKIRYYTIRQYNTRQDKTRQDNTTQANIRKYKGTHDNIIHFKAI